MPTADARKTALETITELVRTTLLASDLGHQRGLSLAAEQQGNEPDEADLHE